MNAEYEWKGSLKLRVVAYSKEVLRRSSAGLRDVDKREDGGVAEVRS
jgi:hypothetical protein